MTYEVERDVVTERKCKLWSDHIPIKLELTLPDNAAHQYAQAHFISYDDRYKLASPYQQHHHHHHGHDHHHNMHVNRYGYASKYNLPSSHVYDNSPSRSLLFEIEVMSIELIILCGIVGILVCGLSSGFVI